MDKKPNFHGSDIEQIAEYYHIAKEDIVNFAANVNPLGLSEHVRRELCAHLDVITRYPDRNYTSLKAAIGDYCSADPGHVLVGNGSTELLSLAISLRAPKKAMILGPSYSEYKRELSLAGTKVYYYNLREQDDFVLDISSFLDRIEDGTEMVIICNPNNPTSSAILRDDMSQIISELKSRGIFLLIDETYVEFAPDVPAASSVSLIPQYDNFMVVRGVSKFFAAPGLRFGYALTGNRPFLDAIAEHQNPWSLNSVGAFAGERMLQDTTYIDATRKLILSERKRLYERLLGMGHVKVYPAYANFLLLRILGEGVTSSQIFEQAIRKGLMIRDCSSFDCLEGEYIRFCIMNPEDNDRLLTQLGTGYF